MIRRKYNTGRIKRYYNGGQIPKYYGGSMGTQYGAQYGLGQTLQIDNRGIQNAGNNFQQYNTQGNIGGDFGSTGYGNNMTQYTQNQYGGNGGYDQDAFFGDMSGTQQGGGISNSTYGMAASVGQLGTGLIEGSDNNQYNSQYGYQGTSAASNAAASTNPIAGAASSVLGMVGSGVDQLTNSQEYNQYGVNTADGGEAITKGQAYAGAEGGFDALGQLTDDIGEGNWGNTFLDLAGLSTISSIGSYNKDQREAEEAQSKAEKAQLKQTILNRNDMRLQGVNTEIPTTANGGVIGRYPNGTSGVDPTNRNIVKAYGSLNNTWSNNPNFTAGELQRYDQPTYVGYSNSTNGTTSGQNIMGNTTFSQDSTAGPQVNSYRNWKDSSTGTDYQIPIFDTNTYDKYFPDGVKVKNKFPIGGQVGQPNAELETKEVFRTPDGEIEKVPKDTPSHAKGGIKMTLPEGTEILGKMKGNYNDKTYKEMGQDIKKRYDKYTNIRDTSKTSLSKKTADMMLSKVQMEFDSLLQDQEFQKGVYKQFPADYPNPPNQTVKENVGKFHPTVKDDPSNPGALMPTQESEYTDPTIYTKGGMIPKYGKPNKSNDFSMVVGEGRTTETDVDALNYFRSHPGFMDYAVDKYMDDPESSSYKWGIENSEIYGDKFTKGDRDYFKKHLGSTTGGWDGPKGSYLSPTGDKYNRDKMYNTIPGLNESFQKWNKSRQNNYNASNAQYNRTEFNGTPSFDWQQASNLGNANQPQVPINANSNASTTPGLQYRSNTQFGNDTLVGYNQNRYANQGLQSPPPQGTPQDIPWWESTLGATGQLAPAAYNIAQGMFGKADQLNASDYSNPYRGQIMSSIGDMKYNIRPELEANELSYQTARRNIRQAAPGTGATLSNYGALSGNRMRADARAYATKQNMENQYRGQKANIMAQLGGQESQTRFNVDQYNAASEAAKRSSLSTGLTQAAQSAYNWTASRNAQRNQDRYYETLNSNTKNIYFDKKTGKLIYNGRPD